jgi:hypothetical protein
MTVILSTPARDYSPSQMHALEGSEYALKSAISAATLGNAALLFSYLSAFAAAITKTVTKGRPEKNRTTSMARFVIARSPNPPTTPTYANPRIGRKRGELLFQMGTLPKRSASKHSSPCISQAGGSR